MKPENYYEILKDDGAPDAIQQFVRVNPDIEVYDYVRRGLNGEVYFGKRRKLGDEVVLKFYWAQAGFDSSEEAVILKNIDHPNILRVDDLRFVKPHFAFFLTPKISGGDLQGIIERESIDSRRALEFTADILKGVNELHANHHLVHRDLKPGNVLFDLNSKRAIIADLGAVKHITKADGHVTASKSTRVYLPPEAIQRNEYFFQSDIYQVGIILFQLLRGFFPVSDEIRWLTLKERTEIDGIRNSIQRGFRFDEMIDQKIIKGKLADTSSLPFYLDSKFKIVVNKAINLNYQKRYKSAADFLIDVHNLIRDYPSYGTIGDLLHVIHDNGKEFRIWKPAHNYSIERKYSKGWRKVNNHDGSIKEILSLARSK